MASRAGAGKGQDNAWNVFLCQKERTCSKKEVEEYRDGKEGDEGAPSGQIQDNADIKINDSNEL